MASLAFRIFEGFVRFWLGYAVGLLASFLGTAYIGFIGGAHIGYHAAYIPVTQAFVVAYLYLRGMPLISWRLLLASPVPAFIGSVAGLATLRFSDSEQTAMLVHAMTIGMVYVALWRTLLPRDRKQPMTPDRGR